MRLHYPIQSACKIELVRFCAQVPACQARRLSPISPLDLPYTSPDQVPAGQARRLACLEAHAAEKDRPLTLTLARTLTLALALTLTLTLTLAR